MNNGLFGLPGEFTAIVPVPAGDLVAAATHGRGAPPRLVRWVLLCKAAESGYVPGDEILIHGYNAGSVAYAHPITWANASQVGLSLDITNYELRVFNKTTAAGDSLATPVSLRWDLKVYANW